MYSLPAFICIISLPIPNHCPHTLVKQCCHVGRAIPIPSAKPADTISNGHSLAPSILQRISQAAARLLLQRHDVSMVAYLDDWFIFGPCIPVSNILHTFHDTGFTVNMSKSHLQPTLRLANLGLDIDVSRSRITPTPSCVDHLLKPVALLPQASRQVFRRITDYKTWLAWAMAWPIFAATRLLQRDSY